MTRKEEKDQIEALLDRRQSEDSVQRLIVQIENTYKLTAQDRPIVVCVSTTDHKAKRNGWPSVKMMQEGVKHALEILPKHMAQRVVVKHVRCFRFQERTEGVAGDDN